MALPSTASPQAFGAALRAPVPGVKASTRAAREAAVEAAIDVMRSRMAEPLTLRDLAHAALLSPYHFNRIFRLIAGVPPGRFLTALRMAKARRLLLTEDLRVTDVCYTVGFDSLGTFTTRFGQLVGVAPMQLRALCEAFGDASLAELAQRREAQERPASGWLSTHDGKECVSIVGLFTTPLPQALPVGCCTASAPGPFWIGPVPSNRYHVLALGFPNAETVLEAMLLEEQLVTGHGSSLITGGTTSAEIGQLVLRPPRRVEPPVVLAAPLLTARAQLRMAEHV